MIYIGIDDTDNAESGGTGRIARELATVLRDQFPVPGVSRHQLLVNDRVPYTRNNSCNVLHVSTDNADLEALADRVSQLLRARCLEGSDPGLCVADGVVRENPFGFAAQSQLVSMNGAFAVAQELQVILRPLGGTGDGVIGALAGAILAAGGNDGRFVDWGKIRELNGTVTGAELEAAGIPEIRTRDGLPVTTGQVDTRGGRVRPLLRRHQPVLVVEPTGKEPLWRVVEWGRERSPEAP